MTRPARPALALALALFAAGAQADDITIDPAIDVNGDGLYSFVELSNLYPEIDADTFTTLDSNGDGLLEMTEIIAATEAGLMPVGTE